MFNIRIFSTLAFLGIFGLVVVFSSSTQENETPALTPDATLEQIVDALATAHTRYDNLHLVMTSENVGTQSQLVHEVWISQSRGSFRHQSTATADSSDEVHQVLTISDGEFTYDGMGMGSGPLVWQAGYTPEEVAFALGGVSTRIAPVSVSSRLMIPEVEVQIAGVEMVNGREALKVLSYAHWFDMHIWVDLETGMIVRDEIHDDGELITVTTTEIITINSVFENADQLFYVDHSAYDPDYINSLIPPELLDPNPRQDQ